MLRTNEQTGGKRPESPSTERADIAMDELARRKAAARRTAWIIGAIAAGFFIASLVQGHFVHIPQ